MKILKAFLILLLGPAIGFFVAFILGALAVPADPNFQANGSHAAPGDGFLIMPFIFVSLIISVPLSIWKAAAVLLGKSRPND
jgi:purine-cytosine permease-like protein